MNNAWPRLTIFKACQGTDHLISVISKTLFPLQENTPGQQNWSENSKGCRVELNSGNENGGMTRQQILYEYCMP